MDERLDAHTHVEGREGACHVLKDNPIEGRKRITRSNVFMFPFSTCDFQCVTVERCLGTSLTSSVGGNVFMCS